MSTLEWPAIKPKSIVFGRVYNDQVFESSFSKAQTFVSFPGAYWTCDMTFENLTISKERILTALIGQLKGRKGTVKVPAWTRFRTDNIGTPVVLTATGYASSMTISGVTTNSKVFSFGDYISAGGELFEVVEDVTSLSDGTATLPLNKQIRATIAASTVIEYQTPFCVMRLSENTYSSTIESLKAGLPLNFREAF